MMSIAAGILGMSVLVFSLSASAADASGNVQSYAAEAPLQNGTIVELTDADRGVVKAASKENLGKMFGVTVDRQQLPVTLSSGAKANEAFVAVSGTYRVLVTTQNGPINAGDYITMSAIKGLGMKAGTDEATVLGRAGGSFDGKGVTLGSAQLTDSVTKTQKQVTLGSVPVTIAIQRNPNEKSTKVNVPEVLERVGQAIAEKEVSPIRLYLSLAITVISVIAAIIIIYTGVRNSIISIGRNPMSKKSIFRALLQIILTSVLILIIGLFAVYLLLRL